MVAGARGTAWVRGGWRLEARGDGLGLGVQAAGSRRDGLRQGCRSHGMPQLDQALAAVSPARLASSTSRRRLWPLRLLHHSTTGEATKIDE